MTATEWFMKYQIEQLKEENRKLKEKLSEITMVADDEKQSIEHILELEEENKNLKAELEWYKTEHERLVDKLVIKWATELLDRKFENKKWWQWE